jgi:hypothetical protein
MKTVQLIGACEKHDLLLYTAKLLGSSGARVLVADHTLTGNYAYIVPMTKENAVITEYDGFDVALGVGSLGQLEEALAEVGESIDLYDYLLIDSDTYAGEGAWGIPDHLYLVSGFGRYTVRKNVSIMEQYSAEVSEDRVRLQLIVSPYADCGLSVGDLKAEFDHLPLRWDETHYEFWHDERDYAVGIANQYRERMTLRGLTRQTRTQLRELAASIADWDRKTANRVYRKAGKRR